MPIIKLPIAKGSYQSESLALSSQRCINWIPVIPQSAAVNNRALFPSPGLSQLGSTGLSPNRGAMTMKGIAYFVNGTALYSTSSTGVSSNLGAIEGLNRVSLANNGRYLVVVVPSGKSYAYDNEGGSLAEIIDPDFRASDTVVFKDGYFVFSSSDGTVFFNSALNNPFVFDSLDFGTAEISPDLIVALHVNHNELFVCGEETIELFQNVGGAGFPFQRIPGANIQKGVHAKHSLVEFDNTFLFIGGGLNEGSSAWKVSGSSSAQKISTSAIDTAIQDFNETEISNCFSWTYSANGSFFAGFTFSSDRIPSKTFVYDATTSALGGSHEWHERQTGVTDHRWRVNSIVAAYGKTLVGDSENGRIGVIDDSLYTEYGETIVRERTTEAYPSDIPLVVGELKMTVESGVGLTDGQGADPQIMMSYSDDGARTFSSEFWRSLGKKGEYTVYPTWRRQGRIPSQRVLRFRVTDPVKAVIIKLEADVI